MTEEKDVNAESSSALGDAIASSPEAQEQIEQQAQESQNPPAETQGEAQEQEAKIPYSRFKEVVDERNYLRQLAEQRLAQSQQQPQQPAQDPFAGMTPEEERFFKMIDARAEKIAEQKLKQISPIIDAGRNELALMKVQQFRASHPDIKPDSPEELAIAEKIQSGYLPEDAYRTVMWDRKVAQVEKQASSVVKQKIEAKKQANVEQRSIPQGATAPTNQKVSQKERIKQVADTLDW